MAIKTFFLTIFLIKRLDTKCVALRINYYEIQHIILILDGYYILQAQLLWSFSK